MAAEWALLSVAAVCVAKVFSLTMAGWAAGHVHVDIALGN